MKTPCKIWVVFYSRKDHSLFKEFNRWFDLSIRLFSGTKHVHSTMILSFMGKTQIVFSPMNRPPVLYDIEQMHRHHEEPDTTFYLGEHPLDLEQLNEFLLARHTGTAFKVYLWFFLLRWISWWKPVTCTTVVCDIMRMCGLQIKRYVNPRNLYRKISNADVSISRTCTGWEDYNSQASG